MVVVVVVAVFVELPPVVVTGGVWSVLMRGVASPEEESTVGVGGARREGPG